MNNEPVAWLSEYGDLTRHKDLAEYWEKINWPFTPLYAHPAKYCPSENNEAYEKGFIDGMNQMMESAVHRAVEGVSAKTLTDEEIHKVDREVLNEFNGEDYVLRFARAILRKASEK